MSILVLNLGSTSFKYELFNESGLESLQKGGFEIQTNDKVNQDEIDHLFREILRQVGDVTQIKAVGHRVVHGGNKYLETKEIDTQEITELEKLDHLAPLHNPYNLAGIKSSNKYLPEVKDFAVFDTVFFKDLPDFAKIYPIPYKYYKEYGIKKFGFHGISHKYAGQEAAKKIKRPFDKCNLITLHLGSGCSVCAISNGKPVDTSMGLTPLEGLMMITRCGDIDAGVIIDILNRLCPKSSQLYGRDSQYEITNKSGKNIIDFHLCKNYGGQADVQSPVFLVTIEELSRILNFKSGIKGVSGQDNYLDLLKAMGWDEPKAKLAFEMFIHRIKKYIGAYMAILNGVDAIVFTGKIGAGRSVTRKKICDKMKILENIEKVVVEPWEELAIAREIKRIMI